MGQVTRGGMWCDYCDRPVAGHKTSRRARNTIAGLLAVPTSGASLLGARVDGYHCPICGSPVRYASETDWVQTEEDRRAAFDAQVALERAEMERPHQPQAPPTAEDPALLFQRARVDDRDPIESVRRIPRDTPSKER